LVRESARLGAQTQTEHGWTEEERQAKPESANTLKLIWRLHLRYRSGEWTDAEFK